MTVTMKCALLCAGQVRGLRNCRNNKQDHLSFDPGKNMNDMEASFVESDDGKQKQTFKLPPQNQKAWQDVGDGSRLVPNVQILHDQTEGTVLKVYKNDTKVTAVKVKWNNNDFELMIPHRQFAFLKQELLTVYVSPDRKLTLPEIRQVLHTNMKTIESHSDDKIQARIVEFEQAEMQLYNQHKNLILDLVKLDISIGYRLKSDGAVSFDSSQAPVDVSRMTSVFEDSGGVVSTDSMGPPEHLDKYVVGEELGQGAFGLVFLVHAGDQKFAMKTMKNMKPHERAMAQNEAGILKQLKHENVIQYVDVFSFGEKFCTVMELASGGDLAEKIRNQKSKGPFSKPFLLAALKQIASGVGHLHEHDVLHRDLKPANILVQGSFHDSKGQALSEEVSRSVIQLQITDFGLARQMLEEEEYANSIVGTKIYMAPEAHTGKCKASCDVWSVGCIFYELCMLKWLFTETSNIFHGEVKRIEGEDWKDLSIICNDMLRRDPKTRPTCTKILEQVDYLKILYCRDFLFTACEQGDLGLVQHLLGFENNVQHDHTNSTSEAMCCVDHAEQLLGRSDMNVNGTDLNGRTILHVAASKGHANCVRHILLQPKVDVDKTNRSGLTTLYIAARSGYTDVVRVLLTDKTIDVSKEVYPGWSALHVAAVFDRSEIVGILRHHLIKEGQSDIVQRFDVHVPFDVAKVHDEGETVLMVACQIGDCDLVKYLLTRREIHVNQSSNSGLTALDMACINGHSGCVQHILSCQDVNVNQTTDGRTTPLWNACTYGNSDCVQLLVSHPEIDPNVVCDGYTALMIACYAEKPCCVRELLTHEHVDVNKAVTLEGGNEHATGTTALCIACEKNSPSCVQNLLTHKDIDVNNSAHIANDPNTPLYIACDRNHSECVRLLLDHPDIDVNHDQVSETHPKQLRPFVKACRQGYFDSVEHFLKHPRFDPNQCESNGAIWGHTGLYKASRMGHDNCVRKILKHPSTDANLSNDKGMTPLHTAARNGHVGCVELLLSCPNIDTTKETSKMYWDDQNFEIKVGSTALHLASRKRRHKVVELITNHNNKQKNK